MSLEWLDDDDSRRAAISGILEEYDKIRSLYERFCLDLERLVRKLVAKKLTQIKVQSISSRLKTRDSLEEKLHRKRNSTKYQSLSEVTDIAGIRIVLNYDDEVDPVSNLIRAEFAVDEKNSVDTSKRLGTDRFGYRSVHVVIGLDEKRRQQSEYEEFEGLRVEVQIRSILQHAWADIEHALNYKSIDVMPDDIKRELNLLAGLLEIGDMAFTRVRDRAIEHRQRMSSEREQEFLKNTLDIDSFAVALDKGFVVEADQKISEYLGAKLKDRERGEEFLPILRELGVKSVGDVQDGLKHAAEFGRYLYPNAREHHIQRVKTGVSIRVLVFLRLARLQDHQKVLDLLEKHHMLLPMEERKKWAKHIIGVYKKFTNRP